MRKYLLFLIPVLSLCLCRAASGETPDTTGIKSFKLGEVVITAVKEFNNSDELLMEDIALNGKKSVSEALDLLPGVTLSLVGGRNEAMLYIRGYDLRQVPVFIDGMPVYVPYDGYIDLARLQTAGISKISVSKGYSSMLYGANSMGGAINIISEKPAAGLSLSGAAGSIISSKGSSGYNSFLNAGYKSGGLYTQGNFSILKRDFIAAPSSIENSSGVTDGKRDNSFTKDIQYQLKAGYETSAGSEYTFSYSGVRSEKGVPVYTGNNSSTKKRYWRYPDWDKDCFYFHSKSALSDDFVLNARAFYDKYYNVLKSFDNSTFTTQASKSAFTSVYDDKAFGGAAELNIYLVEANEIKVGINSKYDLHKEYNEGESPRNFSDNTVVIAAEDMIRISPVVSVSAGLGYYSRAGIKAEDYTSSNDSVYSFPLSTDNSFNYQAGIYISPWQNHIFHLTLARKSRFATMKDRYSYKFGTAIPNPGLHSENSFNTEIGYNLGMGAMQFKIAAYYNFNSNTIQRVDEVEPGIYQLRNTGDSEIRGLEYDFRWRFFPALTFGSTYAFTETENTSNPAIKFTDIPKHKASLYVMGEKSGLYSAIINFTVCSERISTSDGLYKVPGYGLFNISAGYYITDYISINAAVYNMFDRLYYMTEGYPEEGRTITATLNFNLM